jgi:hypothetical protein
MANEICNHGHSAPVGTLENLHHSQAGGGRHKCVVCAFDAGRRWGRRNRSLPDGRSEECQAGLRAAPEMLEALPHSQAGRGRHKCAICAYHAGFQAARKHAPGSTQPMYRGFGDGSKRYQERAQQALPLLVALAKARGTITYGRLALLMDMPNPRNLNAVLGAVGTELRILSRAWKEKIPPLNCLVLNKNQGTPQQGIQFHMPPEKFRRLSRVRQQEILHALHGAIWDYPRWDDVLRHFNLERVAPAKSKTLRAIAKQAKYGRAGGETQDHRRLKEYVKANPHVVGLPRSLRGQTEYPFSSKDEIDVLFRSSSIWVGVEVKGVRSDEADMMRGIFQCVKYKALIEATQRYEEARADRRVILALGGILPSNLRNVAALLQVEVRQKVNVPNSFQPRR